MIRRTLHQTWSIAALALVLSFASPACSSSGGDAEDTFVAVDGTLEDTAQSDTSGQPDLNAEDVLEEVVPLVPAVGICNYVNPFSNGDECKEYVGEEWTASAAEVDCGSVLLGTPGEFTALANCGYASELGRCVVGSDEGLGYVLVSEGSDDASCGSAQAGCELFGGGTFETGEVCADIGPTTGGNYGEVPFVQPYLSCVDPIAGEEPGQTDGKVCTWTLISGCTEAGRHFEDYGSCDDVRTQRPYYGAPDDPEPIPNDPRLEDAEFMADLAWAKSQVEASACICCHSTRLAPDGPSMWYVEAEPIWIDSVRDSGLSMFAGLSESGALGAFPAEDNNGFDRTTLGIPTTDIPRMQAFLLKEWERRGFTPEEGAAYPPFGGPIVDQLLYEPGPCENGEGVDLEGVVTWDGGGARYLYVLESGSNNPGVPPNLDEPEGTLWLVDVPSESDPFSSGVSYGLVAGDLVQRIPESGSPPSLESGKTYYLYVLKDIGFPLARCLFTYPTN